MSLTSALFSGVTGLNAQGNALGILGDNISNQSTVGFKSGSASFSSLVTGDIFEGGGAGVSGFNRPQIDQQGLVQNTGIATDIAISGSGFFVVADQVTAEDGQYLYTRAGSFRQDNRGNFVNAAGFFLQGWPLDNEGRLPGEIGNLNTTSSQLLESLTTVNTRDISGIAFATTEISLGLNLDAEENILLGAGDSLQPVVASINNDVGSNDILVPTVPTRTQNDLVPVARPTGIIDDAALGSSINNDILRVTLGSGNIYDFLYGGFTRSADITTVVGGIYGAVTADQTWDDTTFPMLTNAEFEVTVAGETFTFAFGTPRTVNDTRFFNSLQTLSDALDATSELTSRIVNGQLIVSAVDAREAVTFTDVSGTIIADAIAGNANSLGAAAPVPFANIAAAGPGVNRFNTLQGLADLVNDIDELSASILSPTNDSVLNINAADPLDTVTFTNPITNEGNLLDEFGLRTDGISAVQGPVPPAAGDAIRYDTFNFDPVYTAVPPTGSTSANMASGEISPAFSRNIRIFDSLGVGHDVRVSFVKINENTWAAEVYMANEDEIITSLPNGLMAFGTIEFNGDGSLRNVSAGLSQPITVTWTNEAQAQDLLIDFGTAGEPAGTLNAAQIGQTDGLSQFAGEYTVQFADQNGSSSGLLSSLEIDKDGFVIANFSNGQSREVFKIPIASFPNANGLSAITGNVFSQTDASGEFTLNEAGTSGVGVIAPRALESANVELADELTELIIVQRAYQANTQIITTTDELLEELTRI